MAASRSLLTELTNALPPQLEGGLRLTQAVAPKRTDTTINTADCKQVTNLISPQRLILADVSPSLPPEGLRFRSKVLGHALAWLKREGNNTAEIHILHVSGF